MTRRDAAAQRAAQAVPWPPAGLAPPPTRRRRRQVPSALPGGGGPRARRQRPAGSAEPLTPPKRPGRGQRPRREAIAQPLTAEGIAGNLVITRDQVWAWYALPLQQWSFRPPDELTALTEALTARLSQFAGRRICFRITSQPYPVWQWAADLDASIRGHHPGAARALPRACPQVRTGLPVVPARPRVAGLAGCPADTGPAVGDR
jgi:hypothetical protein